MAPWLPLAAVIACLLAQRAPVEEDSVFELPGPDLHVAGRFTQPDFEQLAGVVPLVDRMPDVEALVALEPHEPRSEGRGQRGGDARLANTGFPFEQDRTRQLQGQVQRRGQTAVGDVRLSIEERSKRIN